MFQYDRINIKQKLTQQLESIIIPTRQEAAIVITVEINSKTLNNFLNEQKLRLFSWILFVSLQIVKTYPQLHRFVLGHKLYQHRFYSIATLVKKDKNIEGYNSLIKLKLDPLMTASQIQTSLDEQIMQVRKPNSRSTPSMFTILSKIPALVIKIIIKFAVILDKVDLLPNFIIDQDPLHSSLVIANLGSIKGQSVQHHLFNFGTASIFLAFGQLDETGKCDCTFTIDERISEGMIFFKALALFKDMMENPYDYTS